MAQILSLIFKDKDLYVMAFKGGTSLMFFHNLNRFSTDLDFNLLDCWRQYDNQAEQAAVCELLRRMNIEVVEMAETLTIFLLLLATVLFRYI